MLDLLCMGEPMVEFSETEPSRYLRGFGGDTSNVAVAAARQGARVGCLGALGDDEFGDSIMAMWHAEGIDTRDVRRDGQAPTGVYFIRHDASGHRFSYLRAGSAASRVAPEHVTVDALTRTRYLHLSAISQAISPNACDACFEAMSIARANGVQVAYDTNLRLRLWPLARARAVAVATLALTDIALPSLDDARLLLGEQRPEGVLDRILGQGAAIVALSMGEAGVWLATPDWRGHVAAHPVAVVDASGAGDTFDGAFLARLAAGDPVVDAGRYANAAAALSTQGYGAVAPIPHREQVWAFMRGPSSSEASA